MKKVIINKYIIVFLFLLSKSKSTIYASDTVRNERPNILWITSEDNGLFLGCYGDQNANTPNLDLLATRGVRYTNCYANSPVSAVARSSIIMGFPAPTAGMHHMRSKIKLPSELVPYPTMLKQAGYYVTNNAKTDYNTRSFDKNIWDECGRKASYSNRKPDQPFFAIFNIEESHEGRIFPQHYGKPPKYWEVKPKTLASDIKIPPYQMSTLENILDWQRMYDKIAEMDSVVGRILKNLELHGEAENTIVLYCSDHGGITLRSKRYLYDSGTRVPLIVFIPPKWQHLAPEKPGSMSERLVQFLDMPRTFLSLAGIDLPDAMTGRVFLGNKIEPQPKTVFLYSNRFDEAPDTRRGITDGRWKYIRNYEPDRPRFQSLTFPLKQAGQRAQLQEFIAGNTTPLQSAHFLPQPSEELYDTWNDPYEIENLVSDPSAVLHLHALQKKLDAHILKSHDLGFIPELLSARVDQDQNQTIYDYGQSNKNYPLSEILAIATLASHQDISSIPLLTQAFKSPNPTIRYWAMVGLRALGKDAISAQQEVKMALKDPEPSVRITATITWGNLGFTKQAANLLLDEARTAKTDLHALWALDGIKYIEQEELVKTVHSKDIVKGRYSKVLYDFLEMGGVFDRF